VSDARAIQGRFALQPPWFKASITNTLPLQTGIGARLAMPTFHQGL